MLATFVIILIGLHQPQSARADPTRNEAKAQAPEVIIETSLGNINVELWPDKAPATVKNFLSYVDRDFYDGTIFHGVIKGFMLQGGAFTSDMKMKDTDAPVKNEARADTPNERGALAMLRSPDVDSATSHFFINLADNPFLNHKNATANDFGFCVFGKVTEGLEIVDKIGAVQTKGGFRPDKDEPATIVLIKSISRVE